MKKMLVGVLMVLLLVSCSEKTSTYENKAKDAYDIMVNAMDENRQMTEEELDKVQDFTHEVKGVEDTTDLDRAISAMEMNFYEPEKFAKAKEAADKLLNN